MANNKKPTIEMRSITKRFLDVTANKNINFTSNTYTVLVY